MKEVKNIKWFEISEKFLTSLTIEQVMMLKYLLKELGKWVDHFLSAFEQWIENTNMTELLIELKRQHQLYLDSLPRPTRKMVTINTLTGERTEE